MLQKCNLTAHARKIREARKVRTRVPLALRPLFNHILKLSADSARHGHCQRAGRELTQAKKLGRS